MSTRMTIQFQDEFGDTFHVYRHCDGFPEDRLPEIQKVIEKAKGRWSGSEVGMLVSMFLGEMYVKGQRLPDYELTPEFHGDESYKYYVRYIDGEWVASVGDLPTNRADAPPIQKP